MQALLRKIRQILKDRRTRKFFTRFVASVSAIVVFVTTYALILPAITLEKTAACGIEEHQHSDSCYEERLVCGQEESDGHHHDDSCYSVTRKLVCEVQEHQHSAENGCYDADGNLVCELQEHVHDDSCYEEVRTQTCGLEESEGHHHTDACYEKVLVCGKEVHVHSEKCYEEGGSTDADTGADVGNTSDGMPSDQSDTGETAPSVYVPDAATEEALPENYVPELDPLDMEAVLNGHTDFYYFHAEEGEEVPADSAEITEWKKVDDGTKLESTDLVKTYLAYTIPAGSLNETNATARYRMPGNLHLSDEQIDAMNRYENGIAAGYRDSDASSGNYQKYLGAEAVEGDRRPDEQPRNGAQEYISAVVRAENVYGDNGQYLGQDLIFTFVPYSIEKNRNTYDADQILVSAGEKITGWFACDFRLDQIDWEQEELNNEDNNRGEDNSGEDTTDEDTIGEDDNKNSVENDISKSDARKAARIIFARASQNEEISRVLVMTEKTGDETSDGTRQDTPEETGEEQNDQDDKNNLDNQDNQNNQNDQDDKNNLDNQDNQNNQNNQNDQVFKAGTLTAEGDDYSITLDYGEDAKIPENAFLSVREITAETDKEAYEACLEQASQEVTADDQSSIDRQATRFFDIEIVVTEQDDDGTEKTVKIEPSAPVSVNIQINDKPASQESKSDQSDPTVLHFAEDGVEQIDSTVTDSQNNNVEEQKTEIQFEAESFSVYGVVYTVDFHWEVNGETYDFSMPGGGFISFYDLVEELGIGVNDTNTEKDDIQELVDGVESITFSAPELVSVSKVDADTTVGAIKDGLDLECEYSAELTEKDIEEINALEVGAGDWALISLKPFDTEESLTVTMKNEDQWTVKVTDAQNGGRSTVTGKLIRYQDAFPDGQYIIFTESNNNYYALTNTGGKVQINYNSSTGDVSYSGNESIIWQSEYVGNSGWKNRYKLNAVDNPQYYLNPGAGSYNNLFRQYYGRVLMERRSNNNTAAFTVKGEQDGYKYLGWSNSSFAATDTATNSIYLARVEDVSTKYTFTVTVDDPSHGTVSGTNDNGTPTGEVSSFTVTTANVDGDGYGNYNAASRPITASASDGYTFSHWEVDNSRYTDIRVLNGLLKMASDNVVLKAVFKQNTTVTDEMTEEEIEAQLTAWASEMMSDTVTTNKTAQVKDYNNRIYEITMSASSGIRRVMPTVDLTFITDVSRSMFFPATLQEAATFTQGTDHETNPGRHQTADGQWVEYDSSLYDWLNRYGDKNTVYYTVADNAAATVMAVYYDLNYYNPADTERTGVWRYYDSSNVNPPDGQNHYGIPVNPTGKNEPWGNNLTGKLYTQVGTLNRMDYLKMAAEAASNVVFGVDPDARVGLVTFAASANQGHFFGNDSDFTDALEAVVLDGGTNQGDGLDKGKDLFSDNERTDPTPKRVAILITDGAPNQSGVNWGTIGQSAIELKNLYGTDSIELYTLGLSMSMVGENNQNRLKEIATGGLDGGHWAMAEKGSDIVEALKTIIGSIVNEASLKGDITDEIDEAFYPVSGDNGAPLSAGQRIDLDGNKIDTIPADGKYGVITFDGTNFGVQWSDQVVSYSASGEPTWEGKICVKAKEDFLGGNSINTNKGSGDKFVPTKYIVDGEEYNLRTGDEEKFTRTFTTPYVNVDELSMTQNSTEWTVYLGTKVNPMDQIKALLNNVNIKEVVSSSTNHMITDEGAMLGSSTTDDSETFPLREVLGPEGLSQDQWNTLKNEGHLNIDYSAYGHDQVGTLVLSLSKVGDSANYDAHNTTVTGDIVEQYIITARYVPAERKDVDYRTTPGGTPGALTGIMSSDNSHIINVYDVPLDVYKTDGSNNPLAGATFKLYKVDDENGSAVTGLNSAHKYVEVAAATSGTDGVAQLKANDEPFGLVRGETYYLIETAAPENYTKVNTVWAVEVQTEIGKFTNLNDEPIYTTSYPVSNEGVTNNMYPFNWDQGARIVLDGKQPVAVIARGETEDTTTTISDGSFVSHKKAIAFRHTVKNIAGGTININVNKRWEGDEEKPDSVSVKLYRISEKDHKWDEGRVVPSTCTADGVKEYTCSVCGEKDTHTISAAGHTPGTAHHENETAPTCTEPGHYDDIVRCTICNAIIDELSQMNVEIPAPGHKWGEEKEETPSEEGYCYDTVIRCSVCGEEQENSRVHHDHAWGEWEVTTPAQPGVAGEENRTCDHGHTETRPIDPLPNTTTITYRFYDYWYNDSYTKTLDVTTPADYTIGSTVTISWTDWEDYTSTLYKNQVPSEEDWYGTQHYSFNNLNGVNVTRTGGGWDQSTYSVTVEVTENMVVDITMRTTGWNVNGDPQNITITQNRSVSKSAQSRRMLTSAQAESSTRGAESSTKQSESGTENAESSTGNAESSAGIVKSGAEDAKSSTGNAQNPPMKKTLQNRAGDSGSGSSLPSFLDGVKTKEQAACGENYWEDVPGTYLITAAEGWSLPISDLPKYNEYGKEYTYYVEETPVTGYDAAYTGQGTTSPEIINTPKVTDLTVTKSWAFANTSNVPKVEGKDWPQGVTVHVVVYSKTGENDPAPTSYTVDLTADQQTYTFTGLPEYSGNNKIEYSVVEAGITGLDSTHFNTVIEGNEEIGYTIRNTEKEAGLTIIKAFEGDTLTDDQKNAISFTVTGSGLKDRSSGSSVESLTKTYAEFVEGQWVLNNSDGIVAGGTYTVTETNANFEKYTRVTSIVVDDGDPNTFTQGNGETNPSANITMDGYKGTVTITNTYTKLLDLNILKVDSQGMTKPLEGAKFELRKVDPENTTLSYLDDEATLPITTGEDHKTGSNGEALFENLAEGYYEIKEKELPPGYIRTGDGVFYIKVESGEISHVERTITVDDEGVKHVSWTLGSDDAIFTFAASSGDTPALAKVGNVPGAALPSTGGPGTKRLYLLGIMLLGLAGAGYVLKWRSKEV